MRVRQGWSGEIAPNRWAKIDVELDEGDLLRILTGMGIDPNAANQLDARLVFTLLDNAAETLVTARLISRYQSAAGDLSERMHQLGEARVKLARRVREALDAGSD